MPNPAHHRQSTCRICLATGTYPEYTAREMMYGMREQFRYFQCAACGCLQIAEVPGDLARHYPDNYYSQMPREEPVAAGGFKGALVRWYCRGAATEPDSLWKRVVRSKLPVPADFNDFGHYLVEARLKNVSERILDVGCGSSPHRLAAFARCGFTAVEGVDPFIPADTNYHGIPVYRKTIDQVDGQYALIMFHHSLEHVPDPVATLKTAARLIRPRGTCLVRIPVVDTYLWNTFGVDWAELDAPRHLYLMAPRTMNIIARESGFRLRKTTFDSQGWEIAASKQYQSDIPLRDPRSFANGGSSQLFTAEELKQFDAQAETLNHASEGGRACFYLEKL